MSISKVSIESSADGQNWGLGIDLGEIVWDMDGKSPNPVKATSVQFVEVMGDTGHYDSAVVVSNAEPMIYSWHPQKGSRKPFFRADSSDLVPASARMLRIRCYLKEEMIEESVITIPDVRGLSKDKRGYFRIFPVDDSKHIKYLRVGGIFDEGFSIGSIKLVRSR